MIDSHKYFDNHFLIAMPGVQEAPFAKSVIYLYHHTSEGAMGFIINRPVNLKLGDIMKETGGRAPTARAAVYPILDGGPVQPERGFVLHTSEEKEWESTSRLTDALSITASRDILESIGQHQGPRQFQIFLGYSGWSAGQLEKELSENSWLTVEANLGLVFSKQASTIWRRAVQKLGISPEQLAMMAGHS